VEPFLIILIKYLVGNELLVAAQEYSLANASEPIGPLGEATGDEADAAAAWNQFVHWDVHGLGAELSFRSTKISHGLIARLTEVT
jgi:hypothetical protein